VKVLLAFLLATFLIGVWGANRGRPSRAWVLGIVSVLLAVSFLSQRVI
jgi:hypothetical protein